MNQTASLWILKKYSVTRLVDRVRCSILFATDAGARLSTILIDYSSVSIEVLQVALSLKSFNPLIRIFIFAKSGYPLSELRTQPRHCARRRVHHQFCRAQRCSCPRSALDIAPADKLYIAIPDSYNLTRKETF